ncbi:scavenger receptor class B member 1-like isoform X2 [Daktulosphaira vitifoliae]|uniref:scavenger receptor class B member 1-like isoform X2 n=1 Tax=Daktulosphaira vitifoliae TaxID=58002 RepID=UPI0021A9C6E3|nr:scavenger receptor class B member 1-like isoform X2 [Daktulosphaira vitifoliae]
MKFFIIAPVKAFSLISLMLIGVAALVLGTLIALYDPHAMILKWKLVFADGDEAFEMWKTPDAPLYLRVYIFNITNHEEFLAGKEKLRFKEVGPYVYRENMAHKNPIFNSNGTITVTPVHPLTWIPELNTGKEDDVLILPNIALLSLANVMSDASIITRMGVNMLIHQTNSQPFVKQTAKEFMFGYESPLVTLGNKFMPSWISFDKLGLIDRMYEFTGDTATFYSGRDDVAKSGLIENYNTKPYLPQWPMHCGAVSGASDGTKFPSLMKPDSPASFFRKSLCRSIPMVRVSNLTYHDGLPIYKYIFKNGSLDNGHDNPENKCFCRKNKCLPSGVIDVTECYYGFPIALSYPHFLQSDPALLEAIDGLKPDKEVHETYFLINPLTGLPTQLYVKMQINLAFGDLSSMANVEMCSNLILPLVWTEIGFDKLPDNMLLKFFIYLRVGPIVFDVLEYGLLIGGVAFIAFAVFASLFIPEEDDLAKYAQEAAWRRKSETLTGVITQHSGETTVTRRASAGNAMKEMNTYYNSLLDPEETQKLNSSLCQRLDVVRETAMTNGGCTDLESEED